MEPIGVFIIDNIADNSNQEIYHSVIQMGADMDMDLNDICKKLFATIEEAKITEVELFPDNVGIQRKNILSFKYEGRRCDIGEHFGTQRDYFWVRIFPK